MNKALKEITDRLDMEWEQYDIWPTQTIMELADDLDKAQALPQEKAKVFKLYMDRESKAWSNCQ